MANQIRMTPDTMRTRAQQYDTQAANVDSVIRNMDSLLRTLQGEWEGEAVRAYAEKFDQLRPGFVKAKDLINDIAKALRSTADMVEQTDQNIASQFRK